MGAIAPTRSGEKTDLKRNLHGNKRRQVITGMAALVAAPGLACPPRDARKLRANRMPYEAITVDTIKGEQHSPSFRTINPNGKVPVIVDPDGPDGDDHGTRRCGDRSGGRGVTITPPACGRERVWARALPKRCG
jgi:hypothetical protein